MSKRLISKAMRRIVIMVCMFLFVACTNNEILKEGPIKLTSQQSDSLLAKYLVVKDDLFVLTISPLEAENEGVRVSDYERYYCLIENINEQLLDAKSQGIPIYTIGDSRKALGSSRVIGNPYVSLIGSVMLDSQDISTSISFQGSSSFCVVANSNSVMPWGVRFRDRNGNGEFYLLGNPDQEVSIVYGSGFDYTSWAWEIIRLDATPFDVYFRFYGANCLSINGLLPPAFEMEIIQIGLNTYTVQMRNEWTQPVSYSFDPMTSIGGTINAYQSVQVDLYYEIEYEMSFYVNDYLYSEVTIFMSKENIIP